MSPSEFITLFVLIAGILYWIDTIFAKEIACKHGKDRCKELGVTFLDATVEITKTRLKRNPKGTVKFKRDYSFEFSSDGIKRYQGTITMLGKVLIDLHMSAYPENITRPSYVEEDVKPDVNSNVNPGATYGSTVVDITDAPKKPTVKNKLPTGFK